MDGYTAFGAAITKDGYKQTMTLPGAACRARRPRRADAGAPARMTSAGYADLLAKIPPGADWIVADALEVEPIDPRRLGARAGPAARARPAARPSSTPATRTRWTA